MDNPYYRGLWYNNADTLDMVERYQQIHGWEFLYTGNRTYREDSYPQNTTVPLKWTDRSLKSLKLSLLRAVLRVNGLEFVTLQPQRYAYVSR